MDDAVRRTIMQSTNQTLFFLPILKNSVIFTVIVSISPTPVVNTAIATNIKKTNPKFIPSGIRFKRFGIAIK